MVERVRQSFEGLSLSMRFVLPIMFAIGWGYYQNDQKSIKESLDDIKSSQTQNISEVKTSQAQIWKTMNDLKDSTNDKFIYIYQHLNR